MPKHGKKYENALKQLDLNKVYSPREALELVKEAAFAKFDETVEVHLRTNLDPRQADQQIRDVVVLPNGLGKQIRVLVFAQGQAAAEAREAGADFVAETDEEMNRIAQGYTDFDVAVGTVDMMGKVGRLGRILGPRNLMPNPKAGRVEFRLDKSANIHVPIGKVSFSVDALEENLAALMSAIRKARPAGAKGNFVRKVTIASTMGPGIKVDPNEALNMESKQV